MSAGGFTLTPASGQYRDMIRRPGGIDPERAISAAQTSVDGLREKLSVVLIDKVNQIERDTTCGLRHMSREELDDVEHIGKVIFNLAGTYGYAGLQWVAVSLLDLLSVMRERNLFCIAPVSVHAQAARLLAPGMPELPRQNIEYILAELKKVTGHLQLQKPCGPESCKCCPARPQGGL
jgi:hypothetical protein